MEKRGKRVSNYITRYVIIVCLLVALTVLAAFLSLLNGNWDTANKTENEVFEWINASVMEGKPLYSSLPEAVDILVWDAEDVCVYSKVRDEYRKNFEMYCSYLQESNMSSTVDHNEVYMQGRVSDYKVFLHYGIYTDNFVNVVLISSFVMLVLSLLVPTVVLVTFLKRNILKVEAYARQFSNENLDVERVDTSIKELNDVVDAIDHMKMTLSSNMKEQWKKESQVKERMATLAHDLKTPLTIIHGNAELLKESVEKSEDLESVEKIIEGSEKIANGVLSILELEEK